MGGERVELKYDDSMVTRTVLRFILATETRRVPIVREEQLAQGHGP